MATGNGGPAFEHWLATGKYLWDNVEYEAPPYQLEVDVGRGVLYLHSLMIGDTRLRICRIPDSIFILSGILSRGPRGEFFHLDIDLKSTPPGRGMSENPLFDKEAVVIYERKPMFLALPDFFDPREDNSFSVVDEAGNPYLSVHNVPLAITKQLWTGQFADITIGVTGR